MFVCFHCKTPWESSLRQPAVKEICEQCGAYLHCCKNCRFHRKGYPNECYIPETEKIADKSRANFCDQFEFRKAEPASGKRAGKPDSFNGLWGEESADTGPTEGGSDVQEWLTEPSKPPRDFDDLFKD